MGTHFNFIAITSILIFLAACSQPTIPRSGPHIDKKHVIKTARQQLGMKYQYGGQSPAEGFDCSGLVYYSFRRAGMKLPRTVFEQLKRSRAISKHKLAAGDLVFFRIYRSRVSHVGIYLGNSRFIHAPSSGKSVSIARLNSPYWQKRFIRAGRID